MSSQTAPTPPEDHIQAARVFGHVIRCTFPDGTIADHVDVGNILPTHFVRVESGVNGSLSDGRIVHEDRVRVDIRYCQPDVQTLPESESLFGEDHDGE